MEDLEKAVRDGEPHTESINPKNQTRGLFEVKRKNLEKRLGRTVKTHVDKDLQAIHCTHGGKGQIMTSLIHLGNGNWRVNSGGKILFQGGEDDAKDVFTDHVHRNLI